MKRVIIISILFLAIGFSQNIYVNKNDQVRLVPRMLNYQGFLTDTLSNPITNPSVSMTFTIFDAALAGNQKWTENQMVSVDKGIFHVLLGSVTPIPDSVFTSSASRWLQLTISGQALSPRTRIVAMPYAYSATYSDTAQYAKSAFADTDWVISGTNMYSGVSGNVGIGTSNPLVKLDVNGVICGGTADTVKALYGGVFSGYSNLAGDATTDTAAIVAGGWDNSALDKYTFVGGGFQNSASGTCATVGGGDINTTSSRFATVAGGYGNSASGPVATVAGGQGNTASDFFATVGGGFFDTTKAAYGGVFSGHHNLAGDAATDIAATVCGGWNNSALGPYTFVGGGYGNTASGYEATVGGGIFNSASNYYATVAGGNGNGANGNSATVGGGFQNSADSDYATVGGGRSNIASSNYATVGGGCINGASNNSATVGGGYGNIANGLYATVGGGYGNFASGYVATVGGGYSNCASGYEATVGGGFFDTTKAVYGGVFSGHHNLAGDAATDTAAIVAGGWDNSALDKYTFVGGGFQNSASGNYATVGGGLYDTTKALYGGVFSGYCNLAGDATTDTAATVCGGWNNSALNKYAFVGGGYGNSASGFYATVSGGAYNTAINSTSTVCGGTHNTASGGNSTVCGGDFNVASGSSGATVGGGYEVTAAAQSSFAANYSTNVLAGHTNSAAFTTSHTTATDQVRAASFSTGTLAFTMDHPNNPMKEILNQYAVGSDDPVLIYNGTAYIAENGRVEVNLPDYFDKITRNPRIQLTGIGTSDVYVAEEISGNRFAIGGKPNTKVYWQVTAERKDINAEIARIQTPVEQPKTGELINHSLDDDALIGIYDDLNAKKPGMFAFKTEEGRRVHEQSKKMIEEKK